MPRGLADAVGPRGLGDGEDRGEETRGGGEGGAGGARGGDGAVRDGWEAESDATGVAHRGARDRRAVGGDHLPARAVELRLRGDDEEGRAAARAETSPRAVGSARDGRKRLRGSKGGGYRRVGGERLDVETGGDAAGRLRFNVARPFERTHTSFAESVAATQSRGSSGRLSGARGALETRDARSRASSSPAGARAHLTSGPRRAKSTPSLFSPFPSDEPRGLRFFQTGSREDFEPRGAPPPVRAENRCCVPESTRAGGIPLIGPLPRAATGSRGVGMGSDAWSPKRRTSIGSRPIHYDAYAKMSTPQKAKLGRRYRRAVRVVPRALALVVALYAAALLAYFGKYRVRPRHHTAPDLPAVLREGEIETSSARRLLCSAEPSAGAIPRPRTG